MLTVKLIDWYIIGIKFCFPKKALTSMLTLMLTSIIDVIFDIDSHANRLAKSVLTGTFARWQALFASRQVV